MTDPAKLSIEAIRDHLSDVEREYDRMARSHDQLASDVRRLWDANQALVQTLLELEWVRDTDGCNRHLGWYCYSCMANVEQDDRPRVDAHYVDCPIAAAIRKAAALRKAGV